MDLTTMTEREFLCDGNIGRVGCATEMPAVDIARTILANTGCSDFSQFEVLRIWLAIT
jgi:hypothetical protein